VLQEIQAILEQQELLVTRALQEIQAIQELQEAVALVVQVLGLRHRKPTLAQGLLVLLVHQVILEAQEQQAHLVDRVIRAAPAAPAEREIMEQQADLVMLVMLVEQVDQRLLFLL
jgi:hypothetical protein